MLVNVPSFSAWLAAGIRNTSVAMSSGRTSPASISGEECQNAAVSVSVKSRTTNQSSLVRPMRCSRALAEPTTGFSPITK